MEIIIKNDAADASATAARVVARLVREKPDAVLGLATGSTPLRLYRELVRMHEEEGLDFVVRIDGNPRYRCNPHLLAQAVNRLQGLVPFGHASGSHSSS